MSSGDIHSIPIQGEQDNFPHLHVVIVELRGQCLVFPGFDAGGYELQKTLKALEKQGLFRHEAGVELDNAQRVKFVAGRSGKMCFWLLARRIPLSAADLQRHRKIGEMDAKGLWELAEGILRLHAAKPHLIPPNFVREIQKLIPLWKAQAVGPTAGPGP
jgi:hypothetical protein